LRKGRVEQVGAPLELYHNPDNKFVAGFIGSPAMNFVAGVVETATSVTSKALGMTVPLSVALPGKGAAVTLGLRPQHLSLDMRGKTHRVEMTEALGGISFMHLTSPTGERLVLESREDPDVKMGDMVGVSFDPSHVMAFDANSEARLR
jgi:lactose/L-arabinose transport system ATP-binding protein